MKTPGYDEAKEELDLTGAVKAGVEKKPSQTRRRVDPRTILKGGEFIGIHGHYFQVEKLTGKRVVLKAVAVREGVTA